MADLFSTITDKAVMDQSQILQWKQGVILAAQEQTNFYKGSPLISQSVDTDGVSASFIKFAQTAGSATLTDGEEVTSTAVVDSKATVTLVEHGAVITTTDLGDVVTDGRLNMYAPELIGRDMGNYIDKYFIGLLEAGSNETIVTQSAETSLLAANVITPTYFEKMYTALRTANIPKIIADSYAVIMHPHVVSDLRNATGAGSFEDVHKYTNSEPVLKNEVGKFRGFKVIESSNVSINADAGDTNVDTYHSCFFGGNALGAAWSKSVAPRATMVTGTDKLDRFYHFGWKGIFAGGLIDSNALQIVTSASAFGAN